MGKEKAILFIAILLVGLIVCGSFLWQQTSKLEEFRSRMATLEERIAELEVNLSTLRGKITGLETKLTSSEAGLETTNAEISKDRGEAEAKASELANIQAAVSAMMTDNEISRLPTPVTISTNDMGAFPDTSALGVGLKDKDFLGNTYTAPDKTGFILYQHDRIADGNASVNMANYVATRYTAYYYDVDAMGTVTQYTTAGQ